MIFTVIVRTVLGRLMAFNVVEETTWLVWIWTADTPQLTSEKLQLRRWLAM